MNKKGFTLVELIAIIVILALVITIAATKGFGLFDKAKNKITQQNINVIKDGVNILLSEVNSCDEDLDEDLITNFSPTNKNCEALKTKFNTECVSIRLDYLISNEYVSGSGAENIIENNPDAEVVVCNGKYSEIINIDKTNGDVTNIVENPFKEGTLAYEIFKNAKDNKNGTKYSPTPLTKPAKEISSPTEKTLSITEDSFGTSYYFRGSVQDNYVLLNNMCFRIVRIEGDGSVKLIFAGDVTSGATTCNEVGNATGLINEEGSTKYVVYGFEIDEYIYPDYENNVSGKASGYTGLKEALKTWYTTKFTTDTLKSKLKMDKWCLGGSNSYMYDSDGNLYTGQEWLDFEENKFFRYAANNRVYAKKTTSLMCENEDYVDSKYGTITSDEVILAGGSTLTNSTYYLYENAQGETSWTLSRSRFTNIFGCAFVVNSSGILGESQVFTLKHGVRPSVTLVAGIKMSSGVGTKTKPYVIE